MSFPIASAIQRMEASSTQLLHQLDAAIERLDRIILGGQPNNVEEEKEEGGYESDDSDSTIELLVIPYDDRCPRTPERRGYGDVLFPDDETEPDDEWDEEWDCDDIIVLPRVYEDDDSDADL